VLDRIIVVDQRRFSIGQLEENHQWDCPGVEARPTLMDFYHGEWAMGWKHYPLTDLATGASPARFGVSGYLFKGRQHVVYQGRQNGESDGHVHEVYQDKDDHAKWHHHDLMTAGTGAPLMDLTVVPWGYAFEGQETQHVVYQASADRHIHELWWDDDWHHKDLTGAGHAPTTPIGTPVGYEFRGTQCIDYFGNDGHIHELQWLTDRGWHDRDLNVAAEVEPVLAASAPGAYLFQARGQRHVVFLHNRHVHELYWEPTSTGDWHYGGDLTRITGAREALGSEAPTGFAFDAEGTQFVHYEGMDSHIILLLWNSRTGWSWIDLTANYGGPLGASPTGYVLPSNGTLHVVYRGTTDGHIHEFWRDSSGNWQHVPNDLTDFTDAPLAVGRPVGYASGSTQHVIYMGQDGRIHELRWVPG
jgi:hypothetical protein